MQKPKKPQHELSDYLIYDKKKLDNFFESQKKAYVLELKSTLLTLNKMIRKLYPDSVQLLSSENMLVTFQSLSI